MAYYSIRDLNDYPMEVERDTDLELLSDSDTDSSTDESEVDGFVQLVPRLTRPRTPESSDNEFEGEEEPQSKRRVRTRCNNYSTLLLISNLILL